MGGYVLCPECGSYHTSGTWSEDLEPGTVEYTCPVCKKVWLVKIDFQKKIPETSAIHERPEEP